VAAAGAAQAVVAGAPAGTAAHALAWQSVRPVFAHGRIFLSARRILVPGHIKPHRNNGLWVDGSQETDRPTPILIKYIRKYSWINKVYAKKHFVKS
jgi:hypothetical protein